MCDAVHVYIGRHGIANTMCWAPVTESLLLPAMHLHVVKLNAPVGCVHISTQFSEPFRCARRSNVSVFSPEIITVRFSY